MIGEEEDLSVPLAWKGLRQITKAIRDGVRPNFGRQYDRLNATI